MSNSVIKLFIKKTLATLDMLTKEEESFKPNFSSSNNCKSKKCSTDISTYIHAVLNYCLILSSLQYM